MRDLETVGLWVNSWVGEIVFGGVNIGRYSGYLRPVSVWPSVSDQSENWVQ